MARIAISYRREDSLVITGRIFDRLVAHYGRDAVFRDIDNIPLGVDFRTHVNRTIDSSDIVLAIVGPRWIGPRANQKRLANPADPVRVEIEAAVRKGVPLIPVLVLGATMARRPVARTLEGIRLPQCDAGRCRSGFRHAHRPADPGARWLATGQRRACRDTGSR